MNNDIFAFSATETGYNHIKVDKVCEDASWSFDDEKMHICVVADGHGSDNYPRTDIGSGCAVSAAIDCVRKFVENADAALVLEDEKKGFPLLLQLSKSILASWYERIGNDFAENPFKEHELDKVSEKYKKRYLSENIEERRIEKAYGCTLIAFVVTEDYAFGLQIGDGKCVVVDHDGDFSEPIPWDDNCQLNVTTSICDSDAIDEFRFCVLDKTPAAVFCGSDGIDDSYASSEEVYALYRSILKIFAEHGEDVGKNEIKEYLPVLTKKGSGDDVSIATIIDLKRTIEISPVLDWQAEAFKLTSELEAKKRKLTTTGEKMDSLYPRIRDFFNRDDSIGENDKFKDLLSVSEELQNEIADIEKRIAELNSKQQDFIFDRDVASFEESIETLEPKITGDEETNEVQNKTDKVIEEEDKPDSITENDDSINNNETSGNMTESEDEKILEMPQEQDFSNPEEEKNLDEPKMVLEEMSENELVKTEENIEAETDKDSISSKEDANNVANPLTEESGEN